MTNLPPWIEVGGRRFVQAMPLFDELRKHAAMNEGSATSDHLLQIIKKYEKGQRERPT